MQQLDVRTTRRLWSSRWVERLLCEQKAEARKQVVHLERSCQPSGESATFELAKENKQPQDQAASQRQTNRGRTPIALPFLIRRPNQEVETAVKDISASLITWGIRVCSLQLNGVFSRLSVVDSAMTYDRCPFKTILFLKSISFSITCLEVVEKFQIMIVFYMWTQFTLILIQVFHCILITTGENK